MNDELVQNVIDVIRGSIIPAYAWDQNGPHASLKVVQDTIIDNLRFSDEPWTKHYRWVPRHVTIVGNIERGLEDIKMSAKARKEVLALIAESKKPQRDVISTTDYKQYKSAA